MDEKMMNYLFNKVTAENRYARQARRIARSAVGFSILTLVAAGYYIFQLDKWAAKKNEEANDIQKKMEDMELKTDQAIATLATEIAEMKETLKLD